MNCFSASPAGFLRQCGLLLVCLGGFAACGAASNDHDDDPLTYQLRYEITPDPDAGTVDVRMSLSQPRRLLREVRMRVDRARMSAIEGDGELDFGEDRLTWRPDAAGGSLSWTVGVAHRRNGSGYDAWLGADWGVFRAEDIIPRAATRTLKGASSATELVFRLPPDWSAVTEYFGREDRFAIRKDRRRFDQPSGWIVLGELGVRRDRIAETRVAVAAPTGQSVRRLEMLALLRWNLPELARVLPELPDRLTIVSAGDPMWRGALSGPNSLYVHARRPLISENATSTLLHEVVHVATGLDSADNYDWIVEGIAEYYSLEMLRRSGTISPDRHRQARDEQRRWGESADGLCESSSTGARTALAVTVLAALDTEIREHSGGEASLDDVVAELSGMNVDIDLEILADVAARAAGAGIETLHTDNLPGCRKIAANER